jgi:hypothetical protein
MATGQPPCRHGRAAGRGDEEEGGEGELIQPGLARPRERVSKRKRVRVGRASGLAEPGKERREAARVADFIILFQKC